MTIYVYIDGFYLPNKPCRPVIYPGGQHTHEIMEYESADPVESVLAFYDQRLSVSDDSEIGTWWREQVNSTSWRYICAAPDINRSTTETGCIYIDKKQNTVLIRMMLLRSEGGYNPCPN
jgi:hypothetical protein